MQPRLFLHLQDFELETRLLNATETRRFTLVRSHEQENWPEQLQQANCPLALVQTSTLSQQEYQFMVQQNLLSQTDVIFISNGHTDPLLEQLLQQYACYHLCWPIAAEAITTILADSYQQLHIPAPLCTAPLSTLDQFGLLRGSSTVMRELYRTLRRVALTDSSVLIVGESGSGKELVANTLHLASPRSAQPFIALNCGALSPELTDSELFGHAKGAFTGALRDHQGVFAQAEGGTLFLDEVTEMPLEQQVKLLRVLESAEYRPVGSDQLMHTNVRIIAATNREPQQAIAEGLLREDLYFRLAQFPVQLPPLRERAEDISGLAQHFLQNCNAATGQQKVFSKDALTSITRYSWPGNVRELKNQVERAWILADREISTDYLQLRPQTDITANTGLQLPTGITLAELEQAAITHTLNQVQGNKTAAASQLGISVKTLYNKLLQYQQ
ncbi:sigma-54 interaction domain-containing protein [Alishewanella longhuensis]